MNQIAYLDVERIQQNNATQAEASFRGDPGIATGVQLGVSRQQLDLVRQVVNVYGKACEPNWDGEGATSISLAAYSNAINFIKVLPANIPCPDVQPDNDGMFEFEWYHYGCTFSIYIGPHDVMLWAKYFDDNNRGSGRFTFINKFPEDCQIIIRQVYAQPCA